MKEFVIFYNIGPKFLSKDKEIRGWSKRTSKDSKKHRRSENLMFLSVKEGRFLSEWDEDICLIRVGIEALSVVAAAAGTLFNKGFLRIQWCRISFVPEKMVFFSILGFLLE